MSKEINLRGVIFCMWTINVGIPLTMLLNQQVAAVKLIINEKNKEKQQMPKNFTYDFLLLYHKKGHFMLLI